MTNFKLQKLKRLSAMPMAEVFYRTTQLLKNKAEKRAILYGHAESVELFVSRLVGEGARLEDKFKNVLTVFQKRNLFAWQQHEPHQVIDVYKEYFADQLEATLQEAHRYKNLEFDIFGLALQFEKNIDWHYDPNLQKSVPVKYWSDINYYSSDVVKEVKYVWELNRCQHFVTLAKAFYVTREEHYAQALFRQWSSWIDSNPYKMGVNWTSSLECAFRLISWTWALAFVRQSGQLNAGLYTKLLQSIQYHAQFIAGHLSKYSSANNHLIGEALGLIYAGAYCPEFAQAEAWRSNGFNIFFKEILRQVHKDGVTAEQTTFYQKYIFDFGVLAMLAAHHSNVEMPRTVYERLEKMAEFYAAIADENGTIPHIGDDDGGCALMLDDSKSNPVVDVLSIAAVLFDRPDFKSLVGSLTETSFWLFENAIEKFEQLATDNQHPNLIQFKDGGYIVLNQEQPVAQKMVFDCGPLGLEPMAAHGHADALSVTLSVNGQPVLIDCGTWLYLGAGEEREYFRSTRAHNTLTVDEDNQSEILGPFQWGKKAKAQLECVEKDNGNIFVRASHDGYRKKGIQHSRSIEPMDGAWVLKDFISGIGNHQIDVYFHCRASNLKQDDRVVVLEYSTFTVEFQFDGAENKKDKLSIEKAWHSHRFGQRDQHDVIQRQVTGPLPLELRTIIKVYA